MEIVQVRLSPGKVYITHIPPDSPAVRREIDVPHSLVSYYHHYGRKPQVLETNNEENAGTNGEVNTTPSNSMAPLTSPPEISGQGGSSYSAMPDEDLDALIADMSRLSVELADRRVSEPSTPLPTPPSGSPEPTESDELHDPPQVNGHETFV